MVTRSVREIKCRGSSSCNCFTVITHPRVVGFERNKQLSAPLRYGNNFYLPRRGLNECAAYIKASLQSNFATLCSSAEAVAEPMITFKAALAITHLRYLRDVRTEMRRDTRESAVFRL
jgi:hypothetical protein